MDKFRILNSLKKTEPKNLFSDSAYSAGTANGNYQNISAEAIIAGIQAAQQLINSRIVHIWKGDGFMRFNLPDKPRIIKEKLVHSDMIYMVAGIGLVCGKRVYKKVMALNLDLRWSDTYIEPEIFKKAS